jgi:ABC-3C biological conflict system middle component
MIAPSKHLDLETSPIRVASEVLLELKRRRVMKYDAVTKLIARRAGDDSDAVTAPALSFLFLVGRIEYHPINDSFEYRAL